MRKFKLSKENYQLLKTVDLSEIADSIVFNDEDCSFDIAKEKYKLLTIILSEDIVARGMDEEQDNCTAFGRKLYALYDEIIYQ